MPDPKSVHGRYELGEVLARGGMGVVYRAFDTLVKRDVALKTLHDIRDKAALQLFYKEWGVLASLVHPNIVGIYDVGEFDDGGASRPFFVMPLLPGATLADLIRDSKHRLSIERAVDIVCQTCRGLQAAHDSGLVHRDVKPSNILVLEDNSVKIIDFGVAHLLDSEASTGLKGTPFYMAPEQIRLERPTPLTDIYALGVVCYEALTCRRPIEGVTESQIAQAILHQVPPPAFEVNAAVSQALSRVVHKAMAKQPWHRFASAREMADVLQKAVRNEPIAIFDPARIQPRIERAAKAFAACDYEFATELLAELEGEGQIDHQITRLRRQLNEALRKKKIQQLLEGSRRCLQEEEHTLALRKIQEALELDPHDAEALSLKDQIESVRQSKKINEWCRLAREHLQNNAFAHARQALQNALDINPRDSTALQLLKEIKGREREFVRLQDEKSKLHDAALQAWEKGEVSAALSKLDRLLELGRSAADTDPERMAGYETFYQQVRSEHDAMNKAYGEARRRLESQKFSEALALCDQYLAKYPGHALFRALKLDVEERQRQNQCAYIAEIDRRVSEEPDLDKCVSLLEEATKRHAGEPHFDRLLQQVRWRHELVRSIVAKAQAHEQKGQFGEAIDQWKILRDIHSQYPGLDFEIERLVKRRDQKAEADAKASWVETIDRQIDAGDYVRALETCRRGLQEFPDDPELSEVLKLAEHASEKAAEASHLFQQGKESLAQERFDQGIELLRKSIELDPKNAVFRAVLAESLLERAEASIDSDWRSAEPLVHEALQLQPGSKLGRSLQTLVSDRKREDAVSWCMAKARKLRAAGDLPGSLELVQRVLSTYPGEDRLTRLRESLLRDMPAADQQASLRRDLAELDLLKKQADHLVDPAIAHALSSRVGEIEGRWPQDPQVLSAAGSVRRSLDAAASKLNVALPEASGQVPVSEAELGDAPPGAGSPEPGSPVMPPPEPESTIEPAVADSAVAAQEPRPARRPEDTPLAATPDEEPATASRRTSRARPAASVPAWLQSGRRQPFFWVGGAALTAFILVVIGMTLWQPLPPPPPPTVAVTFAAIPPGAAVRVTGASKAFDCQAPNCRLSLPHGSYQVEASLAGYRTASHPITLGARPDYTIELPLEPLPTLLRIASDLERGEVRINGEPMGELVDGQFETFLEPGDYNLEVHSRQLRASTAVRVATAQAPTIEGKLKAPEFQAYLVGSFGERAQLHGNAGAIEVSLDGNPVGELAEDALALSGLTEGSHELEFRKGDRRRTHEFEVGPQPSLTAILISDRNIGTLIVTAVDGAEVVINDGRYRKHVVRRNRVQFVLPPGEYTAIAYKEGHQRVEPQPFRIQKGSVARLDFDLPPQKRMAGLQLSGAPADAEVWVDRKLLGVVGSDGAFSGSLLSGEHLIELRKLTPMYQGRPIRRTFPDGAVVTLRGRDLPLQAAKGKFIIDVQPPDAAVHLTIKQPGGVPRELHSRTLYEPPGDYAVSAEAPGFQTTESGRRIEAGQTLTLKLELRPVDVPAPAKVRFDLDDLAKLDGWSRAGATVVRKGDGFSLLPILPASGSYIFTAAPQGGFGLFGKPKIQWVVNYSGDQNYVLCQLDDKNFYRTVVRNGEEFKTVKVAYEAGESNTGYSSVRAQVSADSISHEILVGRSWQLVETWRSSGENLSQGRFGFYTPGKNELVVSHLESYPP